MPNNTEIIKKKLESLYDKKSAAETWNRLRPMLDKYKKSIKKKSFILSERDVVLITYGDGFLSVGEPPLQSLKRFLHSYLKNIVTVVHILPFYPYSSDDGFSVVDYRAVNPNLGTWDEIRQIEKDFYLMFDAVINHISVKSKEFQEFVGGNPSYKDFFIVVEPGTDLSDVFRPRTLPLLSEFNTEWGPLQVWTTFSADQVDLNFKNPDVLLFIIDVLMTYAFFGASMIRLDAIAFLWKEIGTSCIHLPQTHMVIKLFRDIFEYCAPHVKIITETNVPHKENISYFGNGNDEAHLVYNFALPPLTAHTLQSGDATILSKWAESLMPPGKNAYFYNFTASHDGIGVLPAKNILADEQIDVLVKETEKRGGRVSYKSNADGSQSAYELNISLFDLISDPEADEPITTKVKRFIASQAIALSIIGIPAIYYHSIVGSRNYHKGVKQTGMNRAINREKLNLSEIAKDLETRGTIRNLVLNGLTTLIKKRRLCRAFHPQGNQRVLKLHQGVFALERSSPEGNELILSLINVTNRTIELSIDHPCKKDIISGKILQDRFTIDPYEILWLQQYPQS